MEANDCKLSNGAKDVLDLMSHEPTTPKFRNINPKLIDELESILDNAQNFTDTNMSWLNGIYISFNNLHRMFTLIDEIRKALNEGAKFENDFWTGVEESRKANISFMKTLFKSVESGNIVFKQKNNETNDSDSNDQ